MVDFPKHLTHQPHHGVHHTGPKKVAYQPPAVTAPSLTAHHEERTGTTGVGDKGPENRPRNLPASGADPKSVSFVNPKLMLAAIKSGQTMLTMNAKVNAVNAMSPQDAQAALDELKSLNKADANTGFMGMLAVRAQGHSISTQPMPLLEENGKSMMFSFSTTRGVRFNIDKQQNVLHQTQYRVSVSDLDGWTARSNAATAGALFADPRVGGNTNGAVGDVLYKLAKQNLGPSGENGIVPCKQDWLAGNTQWGRTMATDNPFADSSLPQVVTPLPSPLPPTTDLLPLELHLPNMVNFTPQPIHIDIGDPPPPPVISAHGPTAHDAANVLEQQVQQDNDIIEDTAIINEAKDRKDLAPLMKKYGIQTTGDYTKDKTLLGRAIMKRETANAANAIEFAKSVRNSDYYKNLTPEKRAKIERWLNRLTEHARENHHRVARQHGYSNHQANAAFDQLRNAVEAGKFDRSQPMEGIAEAGGEEFGQEGLGSGGPIGQDANGDQPPVVGEDGTDPATMDKDHEERPQYTVGPDRQPIDDTTDRPPVHELVEAEQKALSKQHATSQQAVARRAAQKDEEKRALQAKSEEVAEDRLTDAGIRLQRLADQAHELATGGHQAVQEEQRLAELHGRQPN